VVQLFATRSREAGTRFIVEHGLGARAAVAPIIHGGQPWYVVVYGHYPTRSAATVAIGQLPDALARLKPWPRLVQSLKGAGTTR
jgi:septal ring-binding cell division protein DamX